MDFELIPAIISILVLLSAVAWQAWVWHTNVKAKRDSRRLHDYNKQRERMVKL